VKSDPAFKGRILSYIRSIVRETIDLSLGQQFQPETPGTALFTLPQSMTAAEFQAALDVDSNNVAARVQMHTHSKTCTKYQRKSQNSCMRMRSIPIVHVGGMSTDNDGFP
jgi:hypothetical protein